MLELIKKSVMAGIGAVMVTVEKVHEATRRLVDEGKISREEAEKLAEDLIKSGEKQWEEISNKIGESLKKGMSSLDLVKRKEYKDLIARMELLEQRVASLEDACRPEKGKAD
ncbi:MAG: phasin family protein [Syntrophobacteraceae bacterium]